MEILEKIRQILKKENDLQGEIELIFEDKLDKLTNETRVKYMLLESVLFLDLYKMIRYKQLTNTITEFDLQILPHLEKITTFNQIHKTIIENPAFLAASISSVLDFKESTALEKYASVKTIKEEDKNFLLEIIPLSNEDFDKYGKILDLEDYYKYYKKIKKYYKNIDIKDEIIINQLTSFVRLLYPYCMEEMKNLINELSKIDFEVFNEQEETLKKEQVGNGFRKAKKRFELYKIFTEQEKIEYALKDEYYLTELFETYMWLRDKYKTKEDFEEKVKEKVIK